MSAPIWQVRGYAIKRRKGTLATNDKTGLPHVLFQLGKAGELRDELSRLDGPAKVVRVTVEIRES
jgi:hypothetical protein